MKLAIARLLYIYIRIHMLIKIVVEITIKYVIEYFIIKNNLTSNICLKVNILLY